MRPIDADALKTHVCEMCDDRQRECKGDESCAILCWINDMPTIEAEPVRNGRWIEAAKHRDENGTILANYECSECFAMLKDSDSEQIKDERFCYNCGARMDGGAGMDTGRNILSDDKAKALREIIEQEEAGRVYVIPARGNCKIIAMKEALERAAEQAQQIKQHLTGTRLTPSTEELLEGMRLPEMPKPSTAAEAHERARREFELHEAGRRAYQEPLERLAKEIDKRLERLLTERYPGTPIEAFVSSFIPGGLRITAPDGAAFDFVYRTHGPSTAGGTTTMTMDLTVTEIKIGGEKE